MSDQSFHEIHLGGKQLVFLFMCAVLLTVVVFLFGVSVGRDVRSPAAQTASAPTPTDTVVPAETPPPTQTAPNELSYAQALQGRESGDPSKVTPPAPASEGPPAAAPAQKSEKSAPVPAKKPDTPPAPVAASPGATPATPPAQEAAKKPVPAGAGFFVQVAAFSAKDIADKEVTRLRGKGYTAFVFTETESTPGTRFKVRIGPYSARLEADQTLKKLTKEGYKPFLVKG